METDHLTAGLLVDANTLAAIVDYVPIAASRPQQILVIRIGAYTLLVQLHTSIHYWFVLAFFGHLGDF